MKRASAGLTWLALTAAASPASGEEEEEAEAATADAALAWRCGTGEVTAVCGNTRPTPSACLASSSLLPSLAPQVSQSDKAASQAQGWVALSELDVAALEGCHSNKMQHIVHAYRHTRQAAHVF